MVICPFRQLALIYSALSILYLVDAFGRRKIQVQKQILFCSAMLLAAVCHDEFLCITLSGTIHVFGSI